MVHVRKEYGDILTRRPTRHPKEGDVSLGYHTFKRGDIVTWDPRGEATCKDTPICEMVYGCMVFKDRKQQRRLLITYAEEVDTFSVNAWCSWTRENLKKQALAIQNLSL